MSVASLPIVVIASALIVLIVPADSASSASSSSDATRPWLQDGRGEEFCLNLTASPRLEKFVDALPTMPVISLALHPSVTIGAFRITQRLHRDLPPTTLYAFGTSLSAATYPGPTLVAQHGQTARVRWENNILDEEHFLPLDRTIDWANPRRGGVPHVVHNHGQEDPAWSDGHPEAWFTARGETGRTYVTQDFVYPNEQLPTTLWYHDHTFGITRLNIAAGLVGVYIVESRALTPGWVPREYHTLLIQDKAFFEDGWIKYPSVGINPSVHPLWCPEYVGDVVLVNGMAWPYLDVPPAIQRFRLVNAANSKFFVLTLPEDMRFLKIGTDIGFLRAPISQRTIRIGPAERVDFVIDFSRLRPGRTVEMRDIGPAPFPAGTPINQSVMLFRVVYDPAIARARLSTPLSAEALMQIPPVSAIEETTGIRLVESEWRSLYNRPFVITAEIDSGGGLVSLFLQDRLHFDDPETEILPLYSSEAWALINTLSVAHPIHLHLVNFLVVARQRFNATRFTAGGCSFSYRYPDPRSCYSAPLEGPDQDQLGLKDTAVIGASYVTWFYVTTSPNYGTRYSFDPTAFPHYIWHCHLLEHEDNEMMRPLALTRGVPTRVNTSFPSADVFSL